MQGKTIPIQDGLTGYLAAPVSGRGPGLVVIQEIFGVNHTMRDLADGFAAQGYFALVPDLFWRLEPHVDITDKTDAEWQKAFGLMQRFDIAAGVADIQTTIHTLRTMSGVTGKVGAIGYCLGGLLAYLTATRTDVDAAIGYYGINIQTMLEEGANIKSPLSLHIAAADEYVPPPAQETIITGLKHNPHVTLYRYDGAGHAFARPGGKHYDGAAATLANNRSAEFLREHLS